MPLLVGILIAIGGWATLPADALAAPGKGSALDRTTLILNPTLTNRDAIDFERKLVTAYNDERCGKVPEMAPPRQLDKLTPLSLAILAYCQEDSSLSEEWFRKAEMGNSGLDYVYLLHALHRFRADDPSASYPLWKRLLQFTDNAELTAFAEHYLEGKPADPGWIRLKTRAEPYLSVTSGMGTNSNPRLRALSNPATVASVDLNALANVGSQLDLGSGALSIHYAAAYHHYFQDRTADLFEHHIELPLSLSAGANEDIRIRPFGNYAQLGGPAYSLSGGVGVMGVAYRGNYRQMLQGLFFQDKYFDPILKFQQGSHFRFEYDWEWYSQTSLFKLFFYLEHVQSGSESNLITKTRIRYSHNDIGLQTFNEWDFSGFTLNVLVKLGVREDDNDSSYLPVGGSTLVSKRREDLVIQFQPGFVIPLTPDIDWSGYFKWNRRFSNMGPRDFSDSNFEEVALGTSLAISWGGS